METIPVATTYGFLLPAPGFKGAVPPIRGVQPAGK